MTDLDASNPLAVEILAERASAYFTTTRKLEAALSALAEFDKQLLGKGRGPDDARRRKELFAEAAEQAWFFVIQREAMRLPHYDELFADFGISDEVRRAMGPKSYLQG